MVEPNPAGPLLSKIDMVLLALHSLESVVCSGSEARQDSAEESFEHAVKGLQAVEGSLQEIEDTELPQKLLQWIDEGKDPNAFYQQLFQDTIWSAQACPSSAIA